MNCSIIYYRYCVFSIILELGNDVGQFRDAVMMLGNVAVCDFGYMIIGQFLIRKTRPTHLMVENYEEHGTSDWTIRRPNML